MAAWVLLKHELPDGSWHHDWMVEDPAAPAGRLMTFRLDPRVPWPPRGRFEATQIGPHRREYLEYEGPVSGGRGTVRRVASGRCGVEEREGTLRVTMGDCVVVGRCTRPAGRGREVEGEQAWVFDLVGPDLEAGPV